MLSRPGGAAVTDPSVSGILVSTGELRQAHPEHLALFSTMLREGAARL